MNDIYAGRTLSSNPSVSDLTSSRHLSSVPISPPVNETDVMSSQSRDQSAVDSSMSYTNRSLQNILSPSTVNATSPRRSGCVRVPPNRYGDWVMNQNIVEDSDLREYFVSFFFLAVFFLNFVSTGENVIWCFKRWLRHNMLSIWNRISFSDLLLRIARIFTWNSDSCSLLKLYYYLAWLK